MKSSRHIKITNLQGINDEFHKAFQKIYKKQDVDDSSEAIQDFLDSGDDMIHICIFGNAIQNIARSSELC